LSITKNTSLVNLKRIIFKHWIKVFWLTNEVNTKYKSTQQINPFEVSYCHINDSFCIRILVGKSWKLHFNSFKRISFMIQNFLFLSFFTLHSKFFWTLVPGNDLKCHEKATKYKFFKTNVFSYPNKYIKRKCLLETNRLIPWR